MTPADQTAFDLTNKLVAGEDGEVSSHLAMLLEKSSPLADSEEHYRCILPSELAGLTFSAETRDQIIAILCAEILRNPKESLIAGISFTGADSAIKTAVKILITPPRMLTLGEVWGALSLVTKFLPYRLSEDVEFLSKTELERLIQRVRELKSIEEGGAGEERSARVGIKVHAAEFLRSLSLYGIVVV